MSSNDPRPKKAPKSKVVQPLRAPSKRVAEKAALARKIVANALKTKKVMAKPKKAQNKKSLATNSGAKDSKVDTSVKDKDKPGNSSSGSGFSPPVGQPGFPSGPFGFPANSGVNSTPGFPMMAIIPIKFLLIVFMDIEVHNSTSPSTFHPSPLCSFVSSLPSILSIANPQSD